MSDPAFLIGADLVEFDRSDLPINQAARATWDCFDEAPYGAPLDRLFGEPGEVYVDGIVKPGSTDIAAHGHDPPVALAGLSDSFTLMQADTPVFDPPEAAPISHDGAEAAVVVHLHDGWSWDISGADWTFDFRV